MSDMDEEIRKEYMKSYYHKRKTYLINHVDNFI